MFKQCCGLVFFLLPLLLTAQVPEAPVNIMEQQLEATTENNDDNETEDDSFLQQMQHFLQAPVNLNTADAALLKELLVLTPLQIENIITYRKLFGNFISIYELQAIPGWNVRAIQRILPYVTVSINTTIAGTFKERLQNGNNTFLIRASQVAEQSKGYTSTATNYYPGSPQRLLLRYRYLYKNLLQYGVLSEKDAGEQLFNGTQKQGFDFYSAHIFARDIGIVKSIALGDFTVNMGQGLIQWQSLAFKKGADVINIKRQLGILRPYNSAGEINFHRGFGLTLAKNKWGVTVFVSYKKVDGNFIADTLQNDNFISSLQTSGLHRTKSETDDKGIQKQLAFGGNVSFNTSNLHIGANAIRYHFTLPLHKPAEPYNLYSLNGKNFGNYSLDYSYTFKNIHFFGEAAVTHTLNKAFIHGLIMSLDAKVDMSLLYRNISKSYQSLYSNAFTESTFPNNEKGVYAGISIRPNDFWRIDAYADFYKFPWLKYQVNAPSAGADYLLQTTYKPNKQLEIYLRYRSEKKPKNDNLANLPLSPLADKPRKDLRTHISYKLNSSLTLRNRVEIVWFDKKGAGEENGFLAYADIIYKPMMKRYSGNARLQYFETDGYNSRLYAYENDVLYSYSIPVFYGKGFRYYLNFNYDVSNHLSFWLRWAQTVYQGQSAVGSGLDEIKGNRKSEIKLQAIYRL